MTIDPGKGELPHLRVAGQEEPLCTASAQCLARRRRIRSSWGHSKVRHYLSQACPGFFSSQSQFLFSLQQNSLKVQKQVNRIQILKTNKVNETLNFQAAQFPQFLD